MIEVVLSGGQTGADQAGWRAAKACSIVTGGWMPFLFMTEDGPRPEFAGLYGAKEHPSSKYPPRTQANVRESDATLWFGSGDSRGYWCTRKACEKAGKPFLEVVSREWPPGRLASLLLDKGFATANIAGNRESSSPGIGAAVERYLTEVFRILKEASC